MKQLSVVIVLVLAILPFAAQAGPHEWRAQWPDTNFDKHLVPYDQIMSGGPPKDGIPSIDNPKFKAAANVRDLPGEEPVIALSHKGAVKAYPIRILMWHEIANDTIAGTPVAVTYCPLCNSAIVFKRSIKGPDGRTYNPEFGVSGLLRHSDMIMYDRRFENWWQQLTGRVIVGDLAGQELEQLPSTVMPFDKFRQQHPRAEVLVPRDSYKRNYGANPYAGYDRAAKPFMYKGEYSGELEPMAYVVAVDGKAWPLAQLREKGEIKHDDLHLQWHAGMASPLDKRRIADGRDIGYVTVKRENDNGKRREAEFITTFAFAFKALRPEGEILGVE